MMRSIPGRDELIDWLAQLFEQRGAETYLGESVTVAEHMLQCAMLARAQGAPDALVAAALLHDVGHLTGELGEYSPADMLDRSHELAGSAILEPFFPPVVAECVRLHVAAKRYLCATDGGYCQTLSDASKHSLALQGGPMSRNEADEFTGLAFYREAVQVRRWDDAGKAVGKPTRSFRDFQPLLQSLLV